MNWIECAKPMKGKLNAVPLSGEQEKRVNAWLEKHAPKEWKAISARMEIAEPTDDERKALDASMAARDAEGELENVPHTEWTPGTVVEFVGGGEKCDGYPFRRGNTYIITEIAGDFATFNIPNTIIRRCTLFRLRRRKTAFAWYPKWAIVGNEVRIKTENGFIKDAAITHVRTDMSFVAGGYAFQSDGRALYSGGKVAAEIIALIHPF